ncbi:MAG: hypothetical protein QXG86_00570 [Candidatus Woesearchaeota archaeon]
MLKTKQEEKRRDKIITALFIIITLATFISLIRAFIIGSKAVFDSLMILILLYLTYNYREKLNLKITTTFLGVIFLLGHLLGVNGFYDFYIFGFLGYDKLLHFYGPLVLFFIIFNFFQYSFEYYKLKEKNKTKTNFNFKIIIITLLVTLGINALQEVIEFTGNSVLGNGEGVFFYGSGDLEGNDTPKDLVANFLGATLGGLILLIKNYKLYKKSKNK